MTAPARAPRFLQFRLRTLMACLTLFIVAGNGILVWWRTPFDVESRTKNPSWKHLPLLQREHRARIRNELHEAMAQDDRARVQALQAARAAPAVFVFREKRRVRRNLRGEHVNHGPLEVFDAEGRRLRVEHWSHGKLHGPWIDWDLDGVPLAWGEYRNGQMHGRWRTPGTSYFKAGFEDAVYRHGALVLSEAYLDGKIYARKRYDARGKLVEETRWSHRSPPAVMVHCIRYAANGMGTPRIVMEGRCLRGGSSFQIATEDGLETGEYDLGTGKDGARKRVAFRSGRLVGPDGALAASILPADASDRDPALRELREALDSPLSLELHAAPLDEAVAFIAALHAIPLRLDAKACRRADIDPRQPMTTALTCGLSLRATLQILLADLNLAPAVQGHEVVIAPRRGP